MARRTTLPPLWLVWALSVVPVLRVAHAAFVRSAQQRRTLSLWAKPKRLEENVEGVVYVNDKCINCAACSGFAPATFHRSDQVNAHVVYHQPETEDEIAEARAALAACPVAAIRVETLAEKRHGAADKHAVQAAWTAAEQQLVDDMSGRGTKKPFPKPFLGNVPNVYWLGHHNEASFGAVPYLAKARHASRDVWILVDSPKFSKSAVDAVTSLTGPDGPDYLFLTHVDDTAGHAQWAEQFPRLQRIFHSGDLGRHNWIGDESLERVEVLLPQPETKPGPNEELTAYTLDGTPVVLSEWLQAGDDESSNAVVLHTPGHSPGSISLYLRPTADADAGILFTGDTYGYTPRDGGHMTAFPRYGNNLKTQAESLQKLLPLEWDVIAAGHGHARDYRGMDQAVREREMKEALEEMSASRSWW